MIAVAAGKGGTGKTMVAVNLALALHRRGLGAQLLDADVEEPNAHLFLKPAWEEREEVLLPVPTIDPELCDLCGECARACLYAALAVTPQRVLVFEELCHGCGGCSLSCPAGAVGEKARSIGSIESGLTAESLRVARGVLEIGEPKASPVISRLKRRLDPASVNMIDCGPGTGCAVMTAVRGADVCLMVTEPTPFGLHDLEMALDMAAELGVPPLVVINKDRAEPPEGEPLRDFCRRRGLEVALSIPFDPEIARLCSRGSNLVDAFPEWQKRFVGLYRRAALIAGGEAA